MKKLLQVLTLTLCTAVLASCSSSQYAAQEYDDMYYTASDREAAVERARQRAAERQQAQAERERQRAAERSSVYDQQDAASARQLNPDAVDEYASEEYYEDDYYVEDYGTNANNQAPVYNNYYYGGNPFANYWMNYAYYDPYWGSAAGWNSYGNPYLMGRNSGFSFSINYHSGYGGYYNPWGYDPFYDSYWGRTAGWNGWSMRNPYAYGYPWYGYQDPFWRMNGYSGYRRHYYPSTYVIVSDNNPRNLTYGPRTIRGTQRLGAGTRAVVNDRNANLRSRTRTQDGYRDRGTNERSIRSNTSPNRREATTPANRRTRSREDVQRQRNTQQQRERTVPANRRNRERTAPANNQRNRDSRPTQQRTSPTRSRDNSPSYERSTPSRSRDNGSSTPSRSRTRGGNNLQSSTNAEAPARSQDEATYYAPVQRSRESRFTERRSAQPAYSRPAPQQRSTSSYNSQPQRSSSSTPSRSSYSSGSRRQSSSYRSSSSSSNRSRSTSNSGSNNTQSRSRTRGGN